MVQNVIIFWISGIIIFLLIIINLFLIWYSFKINKRIDKLLNNGKINDFKEVFLSQNDKHKIHEEKFKEAFLKIKTLEDISQTTIQKIGIIRFNPFNNLGGNQSFVVAMLDRQNNGLVISSIFTEEGNRVYSKKIKNSSSEHALSKEEKEAIAKAISSYKI